MITIAKKFEFSASHRLAREDWSEEKNLEVFGKCAHISSHGHNYRLEVIVGGEIDPETGMVIDASKLDDIVQEYVFRALDHKNLNCDVPWLKGINPTTENLINAIWDRLDKPIEEAAHNAQLTKLILHETSRIYAVKTRDTAN